MNGTVIFTCVPEVCHVQIADVPDRLGRYESQETDTTHEYGARVMRGGKAGCHLLCIIRIKLLKAETQLETVIKRPRR